KNACAERLVDLAEPPLDSDGKPLRIRHQLSDDVFGIRLADYHDKCTALVS
ncbi:MAG: HD-GYP domain-containing protein, partial [Gammaproteobacteria bacterium]|nr:HD-GYP domain-containing protein [Gammaproteobacteria bacterium]